MKKEKPFTDNDATEADWLLLETIIELILK